jgi:F-type H+-transporting ATPase subunit epsilon
MRLVVTTPMAVCVAVDDVRHVRAEDETGAFGVQPGHADFITVLPPSVITWRNHDDEEHHVAVRGGVLTVRDGQRVEVATRESVGEDTLRRLGDAVLDRFRAEAAADAEQRTSATRLHLATIRQIQRYLQAGHQAVPQGPPPSLRSAVSREGPPGEGELP